MSSLSSSTSDLASNGSFNGIPFNGIPSDGIPSSEISSNGIPNPLSLPANILATLGSALSPTRSQGSQVSQGSQGSQVVTPGSQGAPQVITPRTPIPPIASLRGYSSPRPPSPIPSYTPRSYLESPLPSANGIPVVPISSLPVSTRSRPLSPIRIPPVVTSSAVTPVSSPVVTPLVTSPVVASNRSSMGSLVPMTTPRQDKNLSMPLEIASEGVLVPEDSIEHMLAKHQYIVTAKILIEGEHGTEARYLEAINPRGKKVFIELDEAGFIAVTPDDLTLHEGKPATVIPYSIKVGALECAALDVCGIAFVCNNGICTLSPDVVTQNKPVETNFIYTEPTVVDVKSDGAARLTDRITPYPIVRLSEIKKKPREVLTNVDEVTRRIRNTAYTGCLKELKETEKASHDLHMAFLDFQKTQMDASTRLTESIRELEEVNNKYIANPPTTEAQVANYRLMIANMRKRHEMVVDLLYTCDRVNKVRDNMLQLKEQLNEASAFLRKEFKNVNYVLHD